EPALELTEVLYARRFVHRPAEGASDERGDRCRNAGDRPCAAGDFLDVYARVGDWGWHDCLLGGDGHVGCPVPRARGTPVACTIEGGCHHAVTTGHRGVTSTRGAAICRRRAERGHDD